MVGTSEANLFDYVTAEEITALRQQAAAVEAAEVDIRRIAAKAEEIDRTIAALSSRRQSDTLNAAARALGEAPPLQATGAPPVDRTELQEQSEGLRERLKRAEDHLKRARGALRASITDLVRTICEQRIGPEYVKAAGRIADLFALLSGAEDFMLSLVAASGDYGKVRHVADRVNWGKLYLPGSTELPALAKESHEEWSLPVVLSGATALERGTGQAALARFRDATASAIGLWPFE